MNDDIDKSRLRRALLEYRDKMVPSSKVKLDEAIGHALLDFIRARNVKVVHTYLPIGSEIDLKPVLEQLLVEGIRLVVPKTLPQGTLEHLELTDLKDLQAGIYATLYPRMEIQYHGSYDIIIVPGLGFDDRLHRLGYGGGYYDRFLSANMSTCKLGVFYPFQKIDKLPIQSHDVAMDIVFCDGVWYGV